MERFIANGWAPECCFSSMWVASDSLNIFLPFVVFLRTVDTFFFDHLTPVCLLVIEALNSIAFTFLDDPSYEIPRELGVTGPNRHRLGCFYDHPSLWLLLMGLIICIVVVYTISWYWSCFVYTILIYRLSDYQIVVIWSVFS